MQHYQNAHRLSLRLILGTDIKDGLYILGHKNHVEVRLLWVQTYMLCAQVVERLEGEAESWFQLDICVRINIAESLQTLHSTLFLSVTNICFLTSWKKFFPQSPKHEAQLEICISVNVVTLPLRQSFTSSRPTQILSFYFVFYFKHC